MVKQKKMLIKKYLRKSLNNVDINFRGKITSKFKEDDLINCHIVLSNYITKEGKVILKRLNDKIKIYKDKHKKQLLLPNPKSEDPDTLIWDLSDEKQHKNFLSVKDNLWIEGYKVSKNSGDTGLQLTYRPIKPLSGGVLQDIIDTMKMTVVMIKLKEVSFDGAKYHVIRKDDSSMDYTAPHWQDNSEPLDGDADDENDRKYPICFTRNTKMKVTIKALYKPKDVFKDIQVKIKGDGPGDLDFPERVAKIDNDKLIVFNTVCKNPFANEVDIFDPLEIRWEALYRDREINIGITQNQCYITLGDPLTTVFHTLVHLGCKNADGETDKSTIVDKIYEEFKDRKVLRIETKKAMTYWSNINPAPEPFCWSTSGLLKYGDGRCGAWADFFKDMIKVQGIFNINKVYVEPPMISNIQQLRLDIKNYLGEGKYEVVPIFYVKNWDLSSLNPFNPIDKSGIPGQGNNDPKSDFTNHAIVEFNNKYYDPSYGSGPFDSRIDWEDSSIEGFGAYIIKNGKELFLYKEKYDTKGILETKFTVIH